MAPRRGELNCALVDMWFLIPQGARTTGTAMSYLNPPGDFPTSACMYDSYIACEDPQRGCHCCDATAREHSHKHTCAVCGVVDSCVVDSCAFCMQNLGLAKSVAKKLVFLQINFTDLPLTTRVGGREWAGIIVIPFRVAYPLGNIALTSSVYYTFE